MSYKSLRRTVDSIKGRCGDSDFLVSNLENFYRMAENIYKSAKYKIGDTVVIYSKLHCSKVGTIDDIMYIVETQKYLYTVLFNNTYDDKHIFSFYEDTISKCEGLYIFQGYTDKGCEYVDFWIKRINNKRFVITQSQDEATKFDIRDDSLRGVSLPMIQGIIWGVKYV